MREQRNGALFDGDMQRIAIAGRTLRRPGVYFYVGAVWPCRYCTRWWNTELLLGLN